MKRIIPIAIVIYFLFFLGVNFAIGYHWVIKKSAPVQPIAFSHKIHVTKVGLQCNFCHRYADKSKSAGVPSVKRCMSCHEVIGAERPEIKKIHKYWEDKEPIPWIRVHRIKKKNYVYFTHKRHIKGGVECSACHGDVGMMERVRQVRSLEMGWCVTCHRSHLASTDCLACHK